MYRSKWGDSRDLDPGGGKDGGEREKDGGRSENDNSWAYVVGRGGRGRGGYPQPEDQREREKRNLQMRKLNKMRLELEGNRKNLGKGQIFTAMKEKTDDGPQKMMTREEMATLLVNSNIKKEDVIGIKFNEYRKGQVEFLLADGVTIDIKTMEEAVEKEEMKISIGAFDHVEEVMMIYGLPLTKDIAGMKMKIEESIIPFVKHIIALIPCTYSEGGDFFRGKYNGNWRVVVEPKKQTGVPNFIVVGNRAKVQGQVNYVKSFTLRPEMCADCFQEGHLKRDRQCPGVRSWKEYCEEFQRKWAEALENTCTDLEEEGAGPGVPMSKLEEMQKELRDMKENNRKMEEHLGEVAKGKEGIENKLKEIADLQVLNREGMEERKRMDFEMKNQEEARMELIKIIEKKDREKSIVMDEVEKLRIEMEQLKAEVVNKEAEKEILARSLGDQTRLNDLLKDINDQEVLNVIEKEDGNNAEIEGNVFSGGIEQGENRDMVRKTVLTMVSGAGSSESEEVVEEIEEQDKDKGKGEKVVLPVLEMDNQGKGLPEEGETKTEEEDGKSKRARESPDNAVINMKKSKSDEKDDIKEDFVMPDTGSKVWIEVGGSRSKWVVQSKKDASKGGGCFNCKGLDNAERKSLNFNTVKWGFLETSSDNSDISMIETENAGGNDDDQFRTPPPPPRYTPPALPPFVPNRIKKNY